MAIEFIIAHPNLNGPHAARVFDGINATLAEESATLGIEHLQTVGGGPETRHFRRGLQRIAQGDVFVRPIRMGADAPTEAVETGAWTWFGPASVLEGAVRLREVALVVTAAGAPMRNPLGMPIRLPDGTRPVTPGSGQQARHRWSGALLFEADGTTPLLVP
jgi:hypothetical protein